ncbi:MAG: hypothetical protein KAU89_05390 [Candidatus Thorarchaeota archaeon]|jgi:hypothetical protein|nr:hypothetical protein [Candidatus Thorarchaeota archaeon]
MEIPMITKFVNGLKIFWESRRLRWLTIVFVMGLLITTALQQLALLVPSAWAYATLVSAAFPMFFLLTALLSLLGLQRFVASEESYSSSVVMFFIWFVVSIILQIYFVFFMFPVFMFVYFGIAFVGWISFQAYFSTRTSLGYAEKADVRENTRLMKGLVTMSHIFCYVVIFGALAYVLSINLIELLANLPRLVLLVLGTLVAAAFNFFNGWILGRQREKTTFVNVALIGLFISLYSGYFIYNAGKPTTLGFDMAGFVITIFFVFYTMSSVGSTLASRAEKETRWKISKELAATLTFFLASGYFFADTILPILPTVDPMLGAAMGDLTKLFIFPLVALVMELLFIRRAGKVLKPAAELPPEEESITTEEDTEPSEKPDVEEVSEAEEPNVEEEKSSDLEEDLWEEEDQ